MVDFLIDNIYVEFGGHVYQVGIPMGTNCAPFLYSYEADFVQHIQNSKFTEEEKHPLISLFAI